MRSLSWLQLTKPATMLLLFDGLTIYINTLKSEISTAKTNELISTDEKSVANKHCNEIVTKFALCIAKSQERLPMFYWLPKLHKRPYKARSIANSSSWYNYEFV